MNQAAQLERIRAQASLVLGGEPLTNGELARIAQTAPAFFYLIESRASGRLAAGKRVTDRFLRLLSEPLFDHLVAAALGFFRLDGSGALSIDAAHELIGIATYLYLSEQNANDFASPPSDEHLYEMGRRLSRLLLVEEQRRAGAFAWVNPYSLLRPLSDDWPARLPVIDRKTEH